MDEPKPTNRLRFVEREFYDNKDEQGCYLQQDTVRLVKVRILQQLWQDAAQADWGADSGEWRDVPIEKE